MRRYGAAMDGSGQGIKRSPRFLVLGTMPGDGSPDTHLAAGPWCFCGQEKVFPGWEHCFTFAREPLADPAMAEVAARAAQALAVRMIPAIASVLTPEAENFPDVYWDVLLAPWAMDVASQIVERCLRAKSMREQWGALKLEVPILPACTFNFADEHDFTLRGSMGVLFNHWLFSRLLLEDWPDAWHKHELPETRLENKKPEGGLNRRVRNRLRQISLNLPFPKMKGMTLGQAIKFSIALTKTCSGPDRSLDLTDAFANEKELAKVPLPRNPLEIFTAALPRSLLQLRHPAITKKNGPPRLRVASIVAHEDAAYRQKLAIWRARGNRLAYCQHGGNYGQVKTPCTAEVVEYSQDAFFTWGWKTQGNARGSFVPLPALQLCRHAKAWHGQESEPLIFVGTEMSAYGHRLDSHPTPMQFVAYRQAKADFFAALPQEIRKQALYRPYFTLPGVLEDAEWLLPRFPEVKLCVGDLPRQLLSCRLLVVDHHGTTMLEAMAADVPMLLYWDRKSWPLTPECDVLVNMLETAGIWHSSPAKAAAKAAEIWHNPARWWQSAEIRMSRHIFCDHQALVKKDAESRWLKVLKNL